MSILVFIPMYNCAAQISRVLKQLHDPRVAAVVSGVVCVDNRSTDGTREAALAALEEVPLARKWLLHNDDNYGLGGSHKVAIDHAAEHGFEYLVVLHGDDQGSIEDLVPHLEAGRHEALDFLMGARFMKDSRLEGYSMLRTAANEAFNRIFSGISGKRLYDLGSGLNLFRVSCFRDGFHKTFADDLTFNYYLILAVAERQFRLEFFPLTWREDDQISNAKLGRMGRQILRLLWQRTTDKKTFFEKDHRAVARDAYPSTVVSSWPAVRAPQSPVV